MNKTREIPYLNEEVSKVWVHEFMTFIKVGEVTFVRIDDIQGKLNEIKKALKLTGGD